MLIERCAAAWSRTLSTEHHTHNLLSSKHGYSFLDAPYGDTYGRNKRPDDDYEYDDYEYDDYVGYQVSGEEGSGYSLG